MSHSLVPGVNCFTTFTARIRRMTEGNNFSLSVHTRGGGGFTSSPSHDTFNHRSHVLSGGYSSFWSPCLGLGYPYLGLGYPCLGLRYPNAGIGYPPPRDWLCCGSYASCDLPQEDFLVICLLDHLQYLILCVCEVNITHMWHQKDIPLV